MLTLAVRALNSYFSTYNKKYEVKYSWNKLHVSKVLSSLVLKLIYWTKMEISINTTYTKQAC